MKNKISYVLLTTIFILTFTLVMNPEFKVNAQDTPFWTGNAYSFTGDVVFTPTLSAGATYRVVASTVFWYNYSGNLNADAQYYTTATDAWNWTNNYPAPDNHSFLLINGADVNWGNFSNADTNHQYSITYLGQGLPISFQVYDWVDQDNSNNYCHIEISIFEEQPAPTPTHHCFSSQARFFNKPNYILHSPEIVPTPTPSPTPTPTPSQSPSPSPSPSPQPTATTLFLYAIILAISVIGATAFIIKKMR